MPVICVTLAVLNEVLSLNAQEFHVSAADAVHQRRSSMKS